MSNSFFSTKPRKESKPEQQTQLLEFDSQLNINYTSYKRDCQKIIDTVYQESDPVLKNLSFILDPDSTMKSSCERKSLQAQNSKQNLQKKSFGSSINLLHKKSGHPDKRDGGWDKIAPA